MHKMVRYGILIFSLTLLLLQGTQVVGQAADSKENTSPELQREPKTTLDYEIDINKIGGRESEFHTYHRTPGQSPINSNIPIKLLMPIFFLIGAAVIYGFIKIILIKFDYNNKLKIERLERTKGEEINRIKVNFYNMISHELKTPLTLILCPIQELKAQLREEKNVVLIDLIEKNTEKLKKLVDQILDYKNHEFEYFKIKLGKVNLEDYIYEIIMNFRNNAARKSIEIKFQSKLARKYVFLDSELFELVINNLLVNAIKFTDINGKIWIDVYQDDSQFIIEIKDNGIGIHPKDLDSVFNKYFQGRNSKLEGSGIGLALAKEIVEKHKGDISVNSRLKKGTTFKLAMPYDLEQEIDSSISDNTFFRDFVEDNLETSLSEKTILIVDDNEDIRAYLKMRLGKFFHVLEAENGESGLKIATLKVPDLVISDIAMPKMDGITMCNHLKSHRITDHIPVILLTARSKDKYFVKSLDSKADDYMSKPFDLEVLKKKIDNILSMIEKNKTKYVLTHSPQVKSEDLNIAQPKNSFVQKYETIIQENINNPQLSIEFISDKMNLSYSQLYRKIKSLTNMTPKQIINSIKLTKAHEFLINGELSISEVMNSSGFNDPKAFRSMYKKKYNCLPSETKLRNRAINLN